MFRLPKEGSRKQRLHCYLNSVDLLALQGGLHNLLCHPIVVVICLDADRGLLVFHCPLQLNIKVECDALAEAVLLAHIGTCIGL